MDARPGEGRPRRGRGRGRGPPSAGPDTPHHHPSLVAQRPARLELAQGGPGTREQRGLSAPGAGEASGCCPAAWARPQVHRGDREPGRGRSWPPRVGAAARSCARALGILLGRALPPSPAGALRGPGRPQLIHLLGSRPVARGYRLPGRLHGNAVSASGPSAPGGGSGRRTPESSPDPRPPSLLVTSFPCAPRTFPSSPYLAGCL